MSSVLVTGAGGFIGGHLVRGFLGRGGGGRAVDCKPLDEWHQCFDESDSRQLDVSLLPHCREAVGGVDEVYNLAADMGGMGFIESNRALCMLSVLISTHMLVAAKDAGVRRLF